MSLLHLSGTGFRATGLPSLLDADRATQNPPSTKTRRNNLCLLLIPKNPIFSKIVFCSLSKRKIKLLSFCLPDQKWPHHSHGQEMVSLRARANGAGTVSPDTTFSNTSRIESDQNVKRNVAGFAAKRVLRNHFRPPAREIRVEIIQLKPFIIIAGLDPDWMKHLDSRSADRQLLQELESHSKETSRSPRALRQAKRAAARSPSPRRTSNTTTQSTHNQSERDDEHRDGPVRKRRKRSSIWEPPKPKEAEDTKQASQSRLGSVSTRDTPTKDARRAETDRPEVPKPPEAPPEAIEESESSHPVIHLAVPSGESKQHSPKSPTATTRSPLAATPQSSHSRQISPAPSLQKSPPHVSRQPSPLRDPNTLEEKDLPKPFLPRQPTPETFADTASSILHNRFQPLPNPSAFVKPLTSHGLSTRSTDTLLTLASNTHAALVAWQEEYLRLDQRTAPLGHPPKKPATGGRVPVEPEIFQQLKEIELWGHVLGIEGTVPNNPKPGPGNKPSNSAAFAAIASDGKRLRRRGADSALVDGAAGFTASENDGPMEKRARKPPRRFDIGSNGDGRRRRRRRVIVDESGVLLPDDGVPHKRGRLSELHETNIGRTASPTPSRSTGPSFFASEPGGSPGPSEIRGAPTRGRGSGGRRGGRAGRAIAATSTVHGAISEYPNGLPKAAPSISGKRGRSKSAKRSHSMAKWWAERKRNQAEEKMRKMDENGGSGRHAVDLVWGGPLDPHAWPGVHGRRNSGENGAVQEAEEPNPGTGQPKVDDGFDPRFRKSLGGEGTEQSGHGILVPQHRNSSGRMKTSEPQPPFVSMAGDADGL